MKIKESEKLNKYLDLVKGLEKFGNRMVKLIPIIKTPGKETGELEIDII